MSANGSAIPEQTSEVVDKGKGKATEQPTRDIGMEDDEEDEEEESGAEEVSLTPPLPSNRLTNILPAAGRYLTSTCPQSSLTR